MNKVDPSGLAAKWAQQAAKQSVPAAGWWTLVQQNAALPKATSPSVSAMAYASLVRQPAQAQAAAAPMSIIGGLQPVWSGTRPIVTPVSQSVSGQAYSGLSAGGEPTFAQGFATSLGRNAVGIATGAAVGLGIAAAVPAAVLASPIVVGVGVTAAVFGAAYGGYRTGLAAYQAWTRNEVDPWTGAATGRTLTRAEQGAATGDFVAGGLTIGAGAAKAVASRFSAAANSNPAGSYRPSTPLPRGPNGELLPSSPYPHTQLGTQIGRKVGPYTAAREFGPNGQPMRDIHFTDHGRPNIPGHSIPHQHRHIQMPTGGTPQFGPAEPFTW